MAHSQVTVADYFAQNFADLRPHSIYFAFHYARNSHTDVSELLPTSQQRKVAKVTMSFIAKAATS